MAARHEALLTLGDRLRARRVELGMSQELVASLVGIDRSYMGQVERGEKAITVLRLLVVADVLKTSASELIEGIQTTRPIARRRRQHEA